MKLVTRYSLLVLLVLLTCYLLPVTSHAQTTASPSGSLVQKLDELKKEIASKAAELKTEVNKKVQDKAIIGSILKIDDSQMLIQALDSVKTINFDEFTEVLGLNDKKIKLATLEVGDDIAALGDFDDKNTLATKRIVFLQNYATSSGELVWGKIQKAQGQIITIQDKSGEFQIISTNAQTTFALGNNDASIADAKAEQFLSAKGIKQKDGSIKARFVYFIPAVGFVKPSIKSASPSASPKK